MSASEIDLAERRYRARLEAILEPNERAAYAAYRARISAALARCDPSSIEARPAEQAALAKIAADTEAAALDRQLLALLRVELLPQ